MPKITIKHENGKIQLNTPYNPDFVKKIKFAGGQWNSSAKVWEMDERNLDTARSIMLEVYGEDDRPTKKVSVRISVLNQISEERGSVCILGRTVAKASGRDSGAKIGDGVCFEVGEATSGGSAKNWMTLIEQDSVIIMHDVPEKLTLQEPPKNIYGESLYKLEIIENKISRDTLIAEREKLIARLEEINQLLN